MEIATGRRPPDLLDIETSVPAQLSVDPLPEDKTQLRVAKVSTEGTSGSQTSLLTSDMKLPNEQCHQMDLTNQVTRFSVWSSPVNANAIASKAWKKERWIRGTVISQEGAMVNVRVDNAVTRVNQSKGET